MQNSFEDDEYKPSHSKRALSECGLNTRSKDKIRPSLGPVTSSNLPGMSAVDTTGAATEVQSVVSTGQTTQPLMMSATATNARPQPSLHPVSLAGAPERDNAIAEN